MSNPKRKPAAPGQPVAQPGANSDAAIVHTPKRPTRSFLQYFRFLKQQYDFAPTACIDLGAGYGTGALYAAFPKAFHLAVEPLEELRPGLEEALAGVEHAIEACVAASRPGRVDLLHADNALTSSIMHLRGSGDKKVKQVEAKRVDDIVSARKLKGPMVLKSDCQGSDIDALRGARVTLKACEVVIVETSFFRFWGDHQSDFYDMITFMRAEGFVVHDLLDGLYRPLDGALGQIDVAFVRADGPFRKKRFW